MVVSARAGTRMANRMEPVNKSGVGTNCTKGDLISGRTLITVVVSFPQQVSAEIGTLSNFSTPNAYIHRSAYDVHVRTTVAQGRQYSLVSAN